MVEDVLLPYIPAVYIFFVVIAVLYAPYVFKNPTKEAFLASYNVQALTFFTFGHGIHDKHFQYVLISFFFCPVPFREFTVYMIILSAWNLFPLMCTYRNEALLWKYYIIVIAYAIIYQHFILRSEANTRPYEKQSGIIARILRFYKTNSLWIMICAAVSMFWFLKMYVASSIKDHYRCNIDLLYEDSTFKFIFAWLMLIYLYFWLNVFSISSPEEMIKDPVIKRIIDAPKSGKKVKAD